MAFSISQHDKVINDTLDDIQSGVFDNIKALENEIAQLVSQGYNPSLLRPQIMAAFRTYSSSVRRAVTPVTDLSADWLKQTGFDKTADDSSAEQLLLDQTQNNIAGTVESFAENVMEVVVLGTAAGVAASTLTQQVRGRISGVMMETNDPEVKRQQRKLDRMLRRGATAAEYKVVVDAIKRKLPPEVNTAGSLRDTAIRTTETSIMGYEGAFSAGATERRGITKWTYEGGIISTSREFCKSIVGNTYTRDQIDSIWSGSWAGKAPGDPMIVRGGYNCLHYWVPVEDDSEEA